MPTAYARPGSTISAGSWDTVGAASLHAALSETTASDAQYCETYTLADSMTLGLSGLTGAGASTDTTTVRYRIQGDGSSGIKVELRQGTTLIKDWTHDPAPSTWTTYAQTLSGAEAASITDLSALRLVVIEV